MISGNDFYKVMCAMVPLYFAMLVAYGSVRWWRIFSAEQCAGINRFVAVFAVPVLSFHFISQNNPYQMDPKFILADTFSKLLVLLLLSSWAICKGQLDWLITLFSLSTLPNTLVMGIPLLKAMYGDFTQSLMVQLLVLQCIIWYTILLFLFEYRAATILIKNQFPGDIAASITKFAVDNDVISLDGRGPLCTESEIDVKGHIRVRIRRSISSSAPEESGFSSSLGITPRASNLSNAEVFSVNTPPGPLHEFQLANDDVAFGHGDLGVGFRAGLSPQLSVGGYASSDAYSLQPTPRPSNFNEMDAATTGNTPMWVMSPASGGKICRQASPVAKETSPGKCEGGGETQGYRDAVGEKEASFRDFAKCSVEDGIEDKRKNKEMPNAYVMLRLILTMVGRKLSRNPNTYSSLLGLLWSLISFKWNVGMPSLVRYSIQIISDAGLGMAMFSLGLFMANQPRIIACGVKMAIIGMVIRFIIGPMVMSAASVAVGLRGVRLHAAIVQAALPQGIVPFVFAREYGLHPDILSTGVIFGMLVSLPVTLLYYILLGL
ncbi:PREDICTED: auxin efflux carrier component 6 [Ipomoea nil]|uniref:auxin efflux carrier component 6 n=1 Tax=Ipomoea nil TaxID=35883 RepID=UPI000901C4CE|nr:PREDICTED: auxin efflux carrier component 6 [Ipomoea nil]